MSLIDPGHRASGSSTYYVLRTTYRALVSIDHGRTDYRLATTDCRMRSIR